MRKARPVESIQARTPPAAVLHPGDLAAFLDYLSGPPVLLDRPIGTDPIGAHNIYYTHTARGIFAGRSPLDLCALHPVVRADRGAIAELLMLGMTLRDRTIVKEIRIVPAGCILSPDGALSSPSVLVKENGITRLRDAVGALREAVESIIEPLEAASDLNLAGLSSGLDSRILAATPKRQPRNWHWLNVAGRDSGERKGATHFAALLRLENFMGLELDPASYLDGPELERGVALTGGMLSARESGMFRHPFERYISNLAAAEGSPGAITVWTSILGDALIGPTYLGDAQSIDDALGRPEMRHLRTVLGDEAASKLEASTGYYRSNPFPMKCRDARETGYLLRLLTRGRRYICGSLLGMFSGLTSRVVSPFIHPDVLDVIFQIDSRYFERDAVRMLWLEDLAPGAAIPNFRGFGLEDYSGLVTSSLARAMASSPVAPLILSPRLLEKIIDGKAPRRIPFPRRSPASCGKWLAASLASRWPCRRARSVGERVLPALGARQSLKLYELLLSVGVFFKILEERGIEVR